jgi:hypothetical protein
MGLQKEIWIADIMETLHEGSEFIKAGTDHSAFVSNKTVHIPQSGSAPGISKNRGTLPATIGQRTDTVLDYNLNEFSTDPIVVTNLEELQVSYAKRNSVLGQHASILNERIGTETAFAWTPDGSSSLVLRTTGSATSELPHSTATGTRKLITKEDIARMSRKLDLDNVPANDRYLVLPTNMYYELFGIDALVRADFGRVADQTSGVVNEIFGFKVFKRATTILFDAQANATKKAIGSSASATDCLGAFAFQKQSVAQALGSVNVFANMGVAEYYGDVMSALIMHGASKMRTDNKGIVALAQGYVAP